MYVLLDITSFSGVVTVSCNSGLVSTGILTRVPISLSMFRRTARAFLRDAVDYHRVLRISRNASKEDVKRAYRQLAKELHPDLNKSLDAPARFKAVQEAHDILMDDARRAAAAMDVNGADSGARGSGWKNRTAQQAAEDAARRHQARDLHRTLSWFELLVHPRILLGVFPVLIGIYFLLNPYSRRAPDKQEILAWFNPGTKRWETPAPWDATFKALNPELKKIERSFVYDSAGQRR